jgi:GAF domain-containing protein
MAQLAAIAIENRFMYERLALQAQHDILTELPSGGSFRISSAGPTGMEN